MNRIRGNSRAEYTADTRSRKPKRLFRKGQGEVNDLWHNRLSAPSHRSLLLIGGTGAGKSVTECYLLTQLFRRNLLNETWAISVKNDSFCGLDRKGRVVLFDRKKVEEAFDALDCVHGIYDERRRLPESKRKGLPPVRLILADWLSVNLALEESILGLSY